MNDVSLTLSRVVKTVFGVEVGIDLTRPDEQFGDYATNVAMQLAGRLQRKPREIAEELSGALRQELGEVVQEITIAGPGFINIRLSDKALIAGAIAAPASKPEVYKDQVVVAEYSDPNPFKVLHAGHLYTTIVGDSVSRLIETAGGTVHRVNFGGDVGLHVGRTMWGILNYGENPDMSEQKAWEYVESLQRQDLKTRAIFMANCYVKGNSAYEDIQEAKPQIIDFNKRVYALHESGDKDSLFAKIYWTCRGWSYEYFDAFYEDLEVSPFEKYYPESQTAPLGIATVKEQLAKGVYEESDGAVIFNGEQFGLHTRVFINSHGLPTYEAKDVGLIMAKWRDYQFDASVIITGNDIIEYMKVVLKSIEQFEPKLAQRSKHMTHGQVKLAGGVKMSSRKGNILYATDILEAAVHASQGMKMGRVHDAKVTAYAAVKHSLLKQRMGGDIIYDPEESVSLEGNSGPYLQYAHARARSILRKSSLKSARPVDLTEGERSLARKISEYPEIIQKAVTELMPHHVCTYLYELAQTFNRFYEHNRVVGDPRETERLHLVGLYAAVLKDGSQLLGITAPEIM